MKYTGQATGTALLCDSLFREHDTRPGHPECTSRYDAVLGALNASGIADEMLSVVPRDASEKDLYRCHGKPYVQAVREDALAGVPELRTGDTSICAHSYDVAVRAAGAVLAAVDEVVEGRARNAFCPVRPPGHHATPMLGMGFCIFNNVAIGARYAQQHHGLERILIVDWDVHHGNGTQDIFYNDGTVFYFSTHQHPWYPGTGAESERGAGDG